jgi:hypothetical protein
MTLTRMEKERITDNRLKIQSVANSLNHIDPAKIPDYDAIQECLEGADKNLAGALQASEKASPQNEP